MDVKLLPQEENSNAKFNGELVITRGFKNTFDPVSFILALTTVSKINEERVEKNGADYLQVCEFDGKKFWVIDDGSYVTCLLPSEY